MQKSGCFFVGSQSSNQSFPQLRHCRLCPDGCFSGHDGFSATHTSLRHPCLKPFHEMPDDRGQRMTWQDYDRNAVRRYARLLRLTDFEIAFTKT